MVPCQIWRDSKAGFEKLINWWLNGQRPKRKQSTHELRLLPETLKLAECELSIQQGHHGFIEITVSLETQPKEHERHWVQVRKIQRIQARSPCLFSQQVGPQPSWRLSWELKKNVMVAQHEIASPKKYGNLKVKMRFKPFNNWFLEEHNYI